MQKEQSKKYAKNRNKRNLKTKIREMKTKEEIQSMTDIELFDRYKELTTEAETIKQELKERAKEFGIEIPQNNTINQIQQIRQIIEDFTAGIDKINKKLEIQFKL